MKEYQENKLILKDFSSSIISSILNYFYSGKIEINLENAIEILIFSSKYLIDELIEFSSNFIKKHFQFETVVDVLKLSESMNFNQLIDPSYQFILENFDEFMKTSFFLELEENHLNFILSKDTIPTEEFENFQSIIKWGKHKSNISQEKENQKLEKEEKDKLKNGISDLIYKIRFIDFSQDEIGNVLKEDLVGNQVSQKLVQFQKMQKNKKDLNQLIEKENQNPHSFIFKSRFKFKSLIIKEMEYYNKIREWINDDEFLSKMKLGFSAKRDGFSDVTFYEKCDNKGKTLVIIKTKTDFIFGGFTSVGFTTDILKWKESFGSWGNISDPEAFIFSLRNDKNDRKPEKFPVQKDKSHKAISYYPGYGPRFGDGNSDIAVFSDFQRENYSNFGDCYTLPDGVVRGSKDSYKYLAGTWYNWEIEELECFFI
eukprot:Anaeramoba_ignava/c16762_g1_i1.p1 GENE.c16762_g1_i1~~c16762_g1_i1.p1  ORF type:complete len:427 (-),score=144.31 c16762_g1_i1:11-1291(-)